MPHSFLVYGQSLGVLCCLKLRFGSAIPDCDSISLKEAGVSDLIGTKRFHQGWVMHPFALTQMRTVQTMYEFYVNASAFWGHF